MLQLATTSRGSRPEIQDDPGGGEGREERDDDLNTTNKGIDSMSNEEPPSRKLSAERRHRQKTKPSGDQEEELQFKATIKGSTLTQ